MSRRKRIEAWIAGGGYAGRQDVVTAELCALWEYQKAVSRHRCEDPEFCRMCIAQADYEASDDD
jgi:hypothetical protein